MANTDVDLTFESVGAGGRLLHGTAGAAAIYTGTMVSQLDADQTIVAGSTAASGPCIGVATHHAAIGAEVAIETDGAYTFPNAADGDACSASTPIGSVVYMYDDHTIADNSNGGARFPAGTFLGMDGDKVRVYIKHERHADLGDIGPVSFEDGISSNTIAEVTAAAGVTVDSLLIKDGGLPGLMPSITKIQVAGGTFAAGTATIAAGIVVTASTDAFVVMSAVITGSTNVGTVAHLKASNVAGGAGVGAVTLNILGDDGAVDADAAGAFRVLLVN